MKKPHVWMVGDSARHEFAAAVAWLREQADIREMDGSASGVASSRSEPHAIVLLQSRPGEISQEIVEQLHASAPLARLVVLVGVFGEGELRSGRPCQGLARIYWHQWAERLPRELGLGCVSKHRRPRAATDADELLKSLTPAARTRARLGLVAICTHNRNDFAALADVCSLAGLSSVWHRPGQSPCYQGEDALLVDGSEAWTALALDSASPQLPSILLANFPRPDHNWNAGIARPARVLARPWLIADLLAALVAVMPAAANKSAEFSAA
jgi:hypothetical protein